MNCTNCLRIVEKIYLHFVWLILLAVTTSTNAYAEILSYTQDRRAFYQNNTTCDRYGCNTVNGFDYPENLFEDWKGSSLSTNGFSATGHSSTDIILDYSTASYYFDINFHLSTTTNFTLTGQLSTNGLSYPTQADRTDPPTYDNSPINVAVSLYSANSPSTEHLLFEQGIHPNFDRTPIDQDLHISRILSPGEYRFQVFAHTDGFIGAEAKYNVDANFSVIPIPGPILLFLSGAMGLIPISLRGKRGCSQHNVTPLA